MKKIIGLVLLVGLSQAENALVVPKKKRVSYSQLQEEIADSYGRIIQQQSTITSVMATANTHLVNRTRELIEGSCHATTQQLVEHRDKLKSFEKELDSFAARSCALRDCVKSSV